MGSSAVAQVAYTQNFTASAASWTGYGFYTGATACGGAGGAVRFNLYNFATSATFASPLLGTATGGTITMSYDYKAANWSANTVGTANPWGNFNWQWSNSPGGPWTTVSTVNSAIAGQHIVSGTCANKSFTFTPTAGPLYMRSVATWTAGDFYLNFDNIILNESVSPCAGTPNPGNTISSANPVCSGANFTLSVQNATPGNGVTRQWQSADDAGFTLNLVNLGTAATQVTSQTTSKFYRCIVTCPAGVPPSGTSSALQVSTQSGIALCGTYCNPTYTTGKTDGDLISNVVISGTPLANNSGTAPVNPAYTFFTGLANYTATLQAGSSYNVTVTIGSFSTQGVAVWIDYNDDGVFSTPSERVGATAGTINTAFGSGTFPISLACNPPLGVHRMRVREVWNLAGTSIDPCLNYGWGECEDYVVTISAAVPCPAPVNLTASAPTVNSSTLGWSQGCAETVWDLHVQNVGGGVPVTPSNPGLTSSSFVAGSLIPGQLYEYYVRAVCGGLAGNSSWAGPKIFSALPPNDICGTVPPMPLAAGATVSNTGSTFGATNTEGLLFPVVWESFTLSECVQSLTVSMCGTIPVHAQYYGPLYSSCALAQVYPNGTTNTTTCLDGNLTIVYGQLSAGTYYYPVFAGGLVPEGPYAIAFTAGASCPPPACASTPSPSDNGTVCPTNAVTLSWASVPFASGYDVYVDGGLVSTNQPGTTYNAGIVSAGAHTWSVTPQNNVGPAVGCPVWNFSTNVYECYCASAAAFTADEEIYSVTVNGTTNGSAANCTTVAPGAGSLLNQYANYRSLGPIFTVQKGVSTSFTVEENECDGATFFAFGTAIWIDYDQNGIFDDNTEKVFVEGSTLVGPRNVTGAFTAPLSALEGTTGMRITVAESFSGATLTSCLAYFYGETEDYLVTITPPPTPAVAVVNLLDDCSNNQFSLDVNISSFGSGGSATIIYSVNGGPSTPVGGSIGPNIIGPFALDANVSVTVDNGTVSQLLLGSITDNCPTNFSCGTTVTTTHCYTNNDPKTFTFISNNANETVTVSFVSGSMDPNDVIRAYSGTNSGGTPIATLTGTFANLSGVTGTSTTNEIFIEIDSDGGNSCFDAQQTTWVFEAECTAGCTDPTGSATVNADCSTIDVEVTFEGDAFSTDLSWSVNGGPASVIPDLVTGDIRTIGPFQPGQSVQIFLLHETDAACNKNLGTFILPTPPNPISVIATATPSTVCAGGSVQLNVVAGNTTAYSVLPTTFGLRSGTPLGTITGDDVAGPLISLPWSTKFFGTSYNQVSLNTNGFMGVGVATSTEYGAAIPSAFGPNNFIAGVKADLNVFAPGTASYFIDGSAPNRVFVASWSSVQYWPSGGSNTFQIMLFEADHHIEVHIAGTTGSTQTCGIENSTGTVGYSPAGRNGAFWSVTTPEAWGFYPSGGGPFTYSWSPAAGLNNPAIQNPIASNINSATTYTVDFTALGCPRTASVTVNLATPMTAVTVTPPVASNCSGGTPVTLAAIPTGGQAPFTYLWTAPNSATSSAQTVLGDQAGTWSVQVTDFCGTVLSATRNVTVVPTPVASISTNTPICSGGDLNLLGNSDQPGSTFLWSGPAPVGGSTDQNVTVTNISSANNGTYSLVATAAGCTSASTAVPIVVNASPSIVSTTATPPVICAGGSSVLDVNATQALPLVVTISSTGFLDESSWSMTNSLNVVVASGGPYGFATTNVTTVTNVSDPPFILNIETQGTFNDNIANYSIQCGTNTLALGSVGGGQTLSSPPVSCAPTFTYAWSPAALLNDASLEGPTATGVSTNTNYSVLVTASNGCTATGSASVTMNTNDGDGDGVIDCLDNCPTVIGQIGSPCNDGNPSTVADVLNATCNCVGTACTTDLTLNFQLDGVSVVNWELRAQGSGAVVQTGSVSLPVAGTIDVTTCLPDGCYYLRVIDDAGDGITGGGYILRRSTGQRIVDNRNNFTSGSVSAIANNEGFCLPMAATRLITTSCDKLDWITGNYIVCDEDLAVSAIWTGFPSGSTQRATSGYEFWFYNPNGGYSFRRFRSHAQSDGFGSAVATRACHAKINGWSGNQLQNNVLYNVRVRTRINNVNGEFGVACRMMLNPLRAQCPLTKLLDTPNSQYFSCNSVRSWGTGNYVHALPVTRSINGVQTSANRYQFRFRIVAENFSVTRTTAVGTQNYFLQLNWGTLPLQPSKTYQVDVRASFDGGATWCTDFVAPALVDPWGPVCNLTIAAAVNGGGQNLAMEANATGLKMYPNPNRGDQLFLSLEQLAEGVNTVSVDIYDTFGKRVSARTIAVQDGFINTVLDLNGEIAAGMYMVNITAADPTGTAGDAVYTERLVIQP